MPSSTDKQKRAKARKTRAARLAEMAKQMSKKRNDSGPGDGSDNESTSDEAGKGKFIPFEHVVKYQIIYDITCAHNVDNFTILWEVAQPIAYICWNIQFGIESAREKIEHRTKSVQHSTLEHSGWLVH